MANTENSELPSEPQVRWDDLLGRNPIFVEYYSHAGCDCYKIKLPWPRYREEKLVLCEVSEGIEHARVVAAMAIGEHISEAIMRPNNQAQAQPPTATPERKGDNQ